MRKNQIVNQAAAFGAILFLASCGGTEEKAPVSPAPSSINAPIIWQTGMLSEKLSVLSIAEDGPVRFLLGYESGGLQLVDFDGTAISEPGPYRTSSIGSGTQANIQGADLILYPGTSRNSDKLVVFLYGAGLPAPFEVELTDEVQGFIEGVCSTTANYDAAILNLAYWTDVDNSTLVRGRVRSEGENLIYEETDRLTFDKYLTSCDLVGDSVITGGGFGLEIRDAENSATPIKLTDVPVQVTGLQTSDGYQVATATSGGKVFVANGDGATSEIQLEGSLSSEAPDKVEKLVLSDRSGEASFTNGFLAIESLKPSGETQLVYVDRLDLFNKLSPAAE
ncbi:MAG: hypothetical protein CMK09_12850 [Ponticaulis sp.]|nr:hypothetical protein [Ponticaulis sp.]